MLRKQRIKQEAQLSQRGHVHDASYHWTFR